MTSADAQTRVWLDRRRRVQEHMTSQHEAAHVAAAWAVGLAVREASMGGYDTYDGHAILAKPPVNVPIEDLRVFWLAGDLWCEHYADERVSRVYQPSPVDRTWRANNGGNSPEAERRCRRILEERRDQVIDLGWRLIDQRVIRWDVP